MLCLIDFVVSFFFGWCECFLLVYDLVFSLLLFLFCLAWLVVCGLLYCVCFIGFVFVLFLIVGFFLEEVLVGVCSSFLIVDYTTLVVFGCFLGVLMYCVVAV